MNLILKKHTFKGAALLLCATMAIPGAFAAVQRRIPQQRQAANPRGANARIDRMSLNRVKAFIPRLWMAYLIPALRLRRALDNNSQISLSYGNDGIIRDNDLTRMLTQRGRTPTTAGFGACETEGSLLLDSSCESPVYNAVGELIFDDTFEQFFDKHRTPVAADTQAYRQGANSTPRFATIQDQERIRDTNLIAMFANTWDKNRQNAVSYKYAHANCVYFGNVSDNESDDGYVTFEGETNFHPDNDGYYNERMGITRQEYLRKYDQYWRRLARTLANRAMVAQRICQQHLVSHPLLGEIYI